MTDNRVIKEDLIKRITYFILIAFIALYSCGCSKGQSNTELSDPNPKILVENTETETIELENTLGEHITSEIYLEELVLAEDKITELLLEEETISEVLLCQTIYVPQDNIEEFAEHSQISGLFDGNVDLSSVLKKIAIGTGVIVTLVVVKRAGLPEPIASVVVAAADKSIQFAKGGAIIGSLFGGLTGASDQIDASGRTSAVVGFSLATVGLILSVVSLIAVIPSGGSTTITLKAGFDLAIAGISVIGATGATGLTGYNAIKTFTSTDSTDIDWDNLDWGKAGVSAAQKAIDNGTAGYMWGSIVGAVYGGVEGYDFYQKFNAPYSKYNVRLMQTPKNDEYGHWSGNRGESDYIYDKSTNIQIGNKSYEIKAGTKVTYKNGVPDFSPFQEAQVKITSMTSNRAKNFNKADEALAEYWTRIRHDGKIWTARDVEQYRTSNGLTWHEMNNMGSMQLVPAEINGGFGHLGGVGEYNAMIGEEGVTDFD